MSLLTFISKKETVSFFENRTLTKAEPLNYNSYICGSFFKTAESYFSDHLYKRDSIIKLYTLINRHLLLKNQINDIVFGDGALLAYYNSNYFNQEETDANINKMSSSINELNKIIDENGGKFIFAGIPAQFSLFENRYPRYFCTYSPKLNYIENNFFKALSDKNISFINMKKEFLNNENYNGMYFKTDHHYNFYGAFFTYQKIIEKINCETTFNLNCLSMSDMDVKTLPNKFLGSSAKKIYDIYPNNDTLVIGSAKKGPAFKRYDSGKEVPATVFKTQNSEYADYNVFMGGDNAETLIDTNRPELPSILIFGDSYTNPLETILYNNFDKTYILDFRYYKEKTLVEYISEKKPDIVLYVRDNTIYLSDENNGDFFGKSIS